MYSILFLSILLPVIIIYSSQPKCSCLSVQNALEQERNTICLLSVSPEEFLGDAENRDQVVECTRQTCVLSILSILSILIHFVYSSLSISTIVYQLYTFHQLNFEVALCAPSTLNLGFPKICIDLKHGIYLLLHGTHFIIIECSPIGLKALKILKYLLQIYHMQNYLVATTLV